jgi:hypothetical protein
MGRVQVFRSKGALLHEQANNFRQEEGIAFCLGVHRVYQHLGREDASSRYHKVPDLLATQAMQEQTL